MAISLVSVTNAPGSTGTVTSFATNVPAGVADGDLLIWTLVANNVTVAPTPSGWSVWQTNSTTGLNQSSFYRIASSEPSSYTASGLTSARWGAAMIALRGVDTTTPQDVSFPAAINGTTAFSWPAITPATSGAWVLAISAMQLSGTGITDVTWTGGNVTVDSDAGAATSNANPFVSHGHASWSSGAFTPTGPTSSPVGGLSRTIGATTAVRPAGATPQTGNINRLTSTGVARSIASTAGAVSVAVVRQTTTGVARAVTATSGVTRAINRLTSTGVARTIARTAGAVSVGVTRQATSGLARNVGATASGTVSRAVVRLTTTGTARVVAIIGVAAPEIVADWRESAAGVLVEPPSRTYAEAFAAPYDEPSVEYRED